MPHGRRVTAVIAGGAGFIGSHLADALLAEGFRVVCIDCFRTGRRDNLRHLEREPRFDLIEADVITLPAARLAKARPVAVFNLACAASPLQSHADPEHTLLTSVVGTRNLLALAEEAGARFLLASTSEVYGDPVVHPQPESYWGNVNPTGPRACYDEGKRAAEALVSTLAGAGRVDARVARIFNTYGPRMRPDDGRVVSNVVSQALTGRDITIYGKGEQTRSFCFVEDMVDGLRLLMDHPGPIPGPVNLGNPTELTIRKLVQRVLALTGSRSRVVSCPLPADDPQRRRPDITLATQLLGWSPRVPLEQGLRRTIDYFAAELRVGRRARPGAVRPGGPSPGDPARTIAATN